MIEVSEDGVELFTQLVEWELLGREACPKALLRDVSLTDLSIASDSLDARGGLGEFVSAQMVELERLYRMGRIQDWNYERDGDNVTLSIQVNKAPDFVPFNFNMQEASA